MHAIACDPLEYRIVVHLANFDRLISFHFSCLPSEAKLQNATQRAGISFRVDIRFYFVCYPFLCAHQFENANTIFSSSTTFDPFHFISTFLFYYRLYFGSILALRLCPNLFRYLPISPLLSLSFCLFYLFLSFYLFFSPPPSLLFCPPSARYPLFYPLDFSAS